MENILVEANYISKKFAKDFKRSLYYGFKDIFNAILKRHTKEQNLRKTEFWAVKNIDFKVKRGQCLGLIGHNGAGKSTLLKMLNGLIPPDKGNIVMRGKVAALIELGAGFNPILTGRENIYNNAAIIGFSKEDIDTKFDKIVAFSEIEEFIDTPVQNYSSGMKVRLGFAIAAQLEPDILIIDEVLAVGDLGFVMKCLKKIDEILPKSAVIFVSHSMPQISRICTHIMLLENGEVKYYGDQVAEGIELYYKRFSTNQKSIILDDGFIKDVNLQINAPENTLNWKEDLIISISFNNISLNKLPYFSISIFDKENKPVGLISYENPNLEIKKGKVKITLHHQKLLLSRGVYTINLIINESFNRNPIYRENGIQNLYIKSIYESYPPFLLDAKLTDLSY